MKTNRITKLSLRTLLIFIGVLTLALFVQQTVSHADPFAPQGASTLGDFVWHDSNVNGAKDESAEWGSSGIDGVVVNLYKDDLDGVFEPNGDDTLVGTLTTGDDSSSGTTEHGWYDFVNITANGNAYWVEIPDSNFASNGALEGYVYTGNLGSAPHNGPEPRLIYLGDPIMDYNDADFGYAKASIELVKTAGNAADGQVEYIDHPQQITYTYVFTNTGETHLSNIVVKDDNGTPNDTSDDFTVCTYNGPLAPNASHTCTYTTANNISADVTNIATVTANPTNSAGTDLPGNDVSDTDDAVVDIVAPAIELIKTADNAADNTIDYINSGDNVVYHYKVTNKGDTYLSNIVVKDDNGTPNDTSDDFTACTITGPLAPNASQTCDYTVNNVTADVTNIATATGNPTDSNGNDLPDVSDVSDTDDAQVVLYAKLGDLVWHDQDADGIQDSNEPGIQGATVKLYKDTDGDGVAEPDTDDGAAIATDTTDANGNYGFNNLTPGDYFLVFETPNGYDARSPQDAGNNDASDSDANNNGVTIVTSLTAGENDLTWDAGYYKFASLGDTAWHDQDADGVQDSGEPGIQGVSVELYKDVDGDGVAEPGSDDGAAIATDTTDSNGNYSFTNLVPGDYFVVFSMASGYDARSPQDAGNDDASDSDANNNGVTAVTNLTSGENDPTWDAGYYKYASLGDKVWHDQDADGVQDSGEPGIQNATVKLYKDADGDGVAEPDGDDGAAIATDTTDSNGNYSFTNLVPGDYFVVFETPTDFDKRSPSTPSNASDPNDSDADSNGATNVTDLVSGETDVTWDAGFYQYASLGDFVWDDKDADGVQDSGEPGIQGATVKLYKDADGDGVAEPDGDDGAAIATDTTDASGKYEFGNLDPGDYFVVFETPTGFDKRSPSTPSNASDPNDSDANSNGVTNVTNLISNEDDPTWDAGFYKLASLGNFVWWDLDEDGAQDSGEPGLKGVSVILKDGNGNTVATTTTDDNGAYSFNNLEPGDYTVVFNLPGSDWSFSPQDNAGDDTKDSDANPNTGEAQTNLSSGENDDTIDAGMTIPSSYTITKENTTHENDLTPGDPISFTISIKNTGKTWLAEVPLRDTYDTTYLTYVNADPTSDDNNNDGTIDWSDLTVSFNQDLAPGATFSVVVNFTAKAATDGLPNRETINTATAHDVKVDPDGPNGPNGATTTLSDQNDTAAVTILNPVDVPMAGFSAQGGEGAVIVSWQSENETDVLGYNLLRSNGNGQYQRVNDVIIFARYAGAANGASYQISDIAPAGFFTYRLEIVRLDGGTEQFGVARVGTRLPFMK